MKWKNSSNYETQSSYFQAWAGGPCHWRPTVQQDGEAPNQEKIVTSCYNGMDESGNYKNATKEGCENAYFTKEGVEVGGQNHKRPTGRKYAQWTNQFLLNWEVGMTHKFDVDPETFRATNCTGLEVAEDGSGFVDGICQINSVCTSKRAFCPVQVETVNYSLQLHRIFYPQRFHFPGLC